MRKGFSVSENKRILTILSHKNNQCAAPGIRSIIEYCRIKFDNKYFSFIEHIFYDEKFPNDIDAVLVSFFSWDIHGSLNYLKKIGQKYRDKPIIIGGYLYGYMHWFNHFNIDIYDYCDAICNQMGEEPTYLFLKALLENNAEDFLKSTKIFYTKYNPNYTEICNSDFEKCLLPMVDENSTFVYLAAGCGRKCSYCASHICKQTVCQHSSEYIDNCIKSCSTDKIIIRDPCIKKIEPYIEFINKAKIRGIKTLLEWSPVAWFPYNKDSYKHLMNAVIISFDGPSERIVLENNRVPIFDISNYIIEQSNKYNPDLEIIMQYLIRFPTETADDLEQLYDHLMKTKEKYIDSLHYKIIFQAAPVIPFYGTPLYEKHPDNIRFDLGKIRYVSPEFNTERYRKVHRKIGVLTGES